MGRRRQAGQGIEGRPAMFLVGVADEDTREGGHDRPLAGGPDGAERPDRRDPQPVIPGRFDRRDQPGDPEAPEAVEGYRGPRPPRRPRALDEKRLTLARSLHKDPSNSVAVICATMGISRATFYRHLSPRDEEAGAEGHREEPTRAARAAAK
jgi:hypothetical protein